MYKFFISITFLFVIVDGVSQEQQKDSVPSIEKDTLVYKTNYGLRLGVDISKPIKAQFDDTFTGFEIVGDYRLSKNFYAAVELGFEEETTKEDFSNSTAKGNYIRVGFNLNTYKNWLDMNNEIFVGYRYGYSNFEQTLNSYTPNVNTSYFPAVEINTPITTKNLNAHWSEIVVGFRTETLKNVFISFSGSYKILMSIKDPDNFQSLFAPGFNRVFKGGTGFGFNYTISYLIPFQKK